MPGLMDTFDSLPQEQQAIARAMSNAARQTMVDHGLKPLNDDQAARLDEACAKYLKARVDADARLAEGRA